MSKSRLINVASGNTIRTIKNPIAWLFRHYRKIARFNVKPLQDGGGLLEAYTDENTMLSMLWASDRIMMDSIRFSRAWRNHFSGLSLHRTQRTSAGFTLTRYTIGE